MLFRVALQTAIMLLCLLVDHAGSDSLNPCSSLGKLIDCEKKNLDEDSEIFRHLSKRSQSFYNHLDLKNNKIQRLRSHMFSGLPSLQKLVLEKNSIMTIDKDAFKGLNKLETLNLNDNGPGIIKNLNEALKVLPNLKRLSLAGNKIEFLVNDGVALLQGLNSLRYLDISRNMLSSINQDEIKSFIPLQILDMSQNQIVSVGDVAFKHLVELREVYLSQNRIATLGKGIFVDTKIRKLEVDNNELSVFDSGWLFQPGNTLKELNLASNKIATIAGGDWDCCRNLVNLSLANNPISSLNAVGGPAESSVFQKLDQLELLDLSYCELKYLPENVFKRMNNLKTLNVSHNSLGVGMSDGVIFTQLGPLSSLRTLDLSYNSVQLVFQNVFGNLPSLRRLFLHGNEITSITENPFRGLDKLRKLEMDSSSLLCGCGLTEFLKWLSYKNLQIDVKCAAPELLLGKHFSSLELDQLICSVDGIGPHIETHPRSQQVVQGQNISFTCTAVTPASSDRVNIRWKKGGQYLNKSPAVRAEFRSDSNMSTVTSVLKLDNVLLNQTGNYQCIVSTNHTTMFSNRAQLKIFVMPYFSRRPENVSVDAGRIAKLRCEAKGYPEPEIKWYKAGGEHFEAARDGHIFPSNQLLLEELVIIKVKPSYSGIYTCVANNSAGSASASAALIVRAPPEFVGKKLPSLTRASSGKSTVLRCSLEGHPFPEIMWYKDTEVIQPSSKLILAERNQTLVIADVNEDDIAVYECRALNKFGAIHAQTQLRLGPSPRPNQPASSSGGISSSMLIGVVVIAVVCCIIITSIIWLLFIYKSRRRAGRPFCKCLGVETPPSYHNSSCMMMSESTTNPGLYTEYMRDDNHAANSTAPLLSGKPQETTQFIEHYDPDLSIIQPRVKEITAERSSSGCSSSSSLDKIGRREADIDGSIRPGVELPSGPERSLTPKEYSASAARQVVLPMPNTDGPDRAVTSLHTFEPGPNRRNCSLPRQRLVPVRISDATSLQRRRSADDLLDSQPADTSQTRSNASRGHDPPPLPPKAVFRKASLLGSQSCLTQSLCSPSVDDILEQSTT